MNEPGLGVTGIDPGTAMQYLEETNPRPFNCEPSSLTTTPSSRSLKMDVTMDSELDLPIQVSGCVSSPVGASRIQSKSSRSLQETF